jgi:hypothetical protein
MQRGNTAVTRAKNASVDTVEAITDTDFSAGTEGWEWNTVADVEPTRVLFDTFGDQFVGQFMGLVTIAPDDGSEPFELYTFTATDGELYAINSSWKMNKGMKDVTPGEWCRITYVKDIPSSKGNPVKDLRIDVRR